LKVEFELLVLSSDLIGSKDLMNEELSLSLPHLAKEEKY